MDFETSFDDFALEDSGKRFIALEISDHEDDYNSSMDSVNCIETTASHVELELSCISPEHPAPSVPESRPETPVAQKKAAQDMPIRTSSKRSRDEKKRWSFISTSSSAKKRWSTLSFASDTKSNKRLSVVSTDSTSKKSSVQSLNKQNSSIKLKRSSTGASLRSMFSKIVLKDEDKENVEVMAHKRSSTAKNVKPSIFSNASVSSIRAPLNPISINSRRDQRYSNTNFSSSIDNVSVMSQSSMTSLNAKWKFWKRKNESIDQGFQAPANSMRNKNSLSDLRKSIFQNSLLSSTDSIAEIKSRRSHSSLKNQSSHSSLKHKGSHPSLKKLRTRRNSSIASSDSSLPQISLPIPDQVSRDKIRTKLRHSSSLMSINSNLFGGSVIIAETEEYDESVLQSMIDLCSTKKVLPYSLSPKLKQSDRFIYFDESDNSIYKIVPLDDDNAECNMTRQMRLKELQLAVLMSGTPGFCSILNTKIVKREEDQSLFLIYHMKDHGKSLNDKIIKEKYKFSSHEIKEILIQCIRALYVAETKFQFEHRFLTLDHILMDSQGNITIIDYKLSRAAYGSQVLFTRLDHPLFFESKKDYNFVLQWLRKTVLVEHWSSFNPKTNIVWMNYIITKLLQNSSEPNVRNPVVETIYHCLDLSKPRKIWKRNEGFVESCVDIVSIL